MNCMKSLCLKFVSLFSLATWQLVEWVATWSLNFFASSRTSLSQFVIEVVPKYLRSFPFEGSVIFKVLGHALFHRNSQNIELVFCVLWHSRDIRIGGRYFRRFSKFTALDLGLDIYSCHTELSGLFQRFPEPCGNSNENEPKMAWSPAGCQTNHSNLSFSPVFLKF